MQPPLLDAQAEGEIEAVVDRNGIPVGVVRGLETAGLGRPGTNDPRRCGPEPALACTSRHETNSSRPATLGAPERRLQAIRIESGEPARPLTAFPPPDHGRFTLVTGAGP